MLVKNFYSNGKLLLTGEYLVMDGATSLAVPTKYGQDLTVEKIRSPYLIWESFNENGNQWFSSKFELPTLKSDTNNKIASTLLNILKEAQNLNPEFLSDEYGLHVKTKLSFPKNWGLGTSSTLINNIALWANIDAFKLLKNSFGGSGYDIACARNNSPVIYQLVDKKPSVEVVNFSPSFKDHLYFVYLNKKQDSKEGIKKYREFKGNTLALAEEISQLTMQVLDCTDLTVFENILVEHENLISGIIQQKPIQRELFPDYFGQTKSLGAWGGDFILATGNKDTPDYFKNKGFDTVISYEQMIL